MKTMKRWRIILMMFVVFSFNACQLFTSKKAHSIEQQTDSIIAKSSPRVNLAEGIHLLLKGGSPKLPLDSIVVEMVNNTDSTCMTGEAYTIEQRVNGEWTVLPIKPRKDGAVYAFNDIGYELAPHSSRQFSIHVEPDKYDFEREKEYRIAKDFLKSGQSNPLSVYCHFTIE